jgi:hypothetical protein
MKWPRGAVGLAILLVVGATLASGGSETDSLRQHYLPSANALRTIARYGTERVVTVRSLGDPDIVRSDPEWLAAARPLGSEAPRWARRMYSRSLLVLHALSDSGTGAALAGAREGWAYVWPRDAGAVAIALRRRGTDVKRGASCASCVGSMGAAARFHPNGTPVDGRAAQGDAAGWVDAAAAAAKLPSTATERPWRGLADYQESGSGDFIGDAIASGEPHVQALFETPSGTLAPAPEIRTPVSTPLPHGRSVLFHVLRSTHSSGAHCCDWLPAAAASASFPQKTGTAARIRGQHRPPGRRGASPRSASGAQPCT